MRSTNTYARIVRNLWRIVTKTLTNQGLTRRSAAIAASDPWPTSPSGRVQSRRNRRPTIMPQPQQAPTPGSTRPFLAAAMAAVLWAALSTASFGQNTIAPMIERVVPTVVSIAVRGQVQEEVDPLLSDPFFRKFFGLPEGSAPSRHEFRAAGSGVIVDAANGYIITNNHVVENATEITVTPVGGGAFPGKVIGRDPETDIAVVQIDAPNLRAIDFGDSSALHVGDYVAAIGNPFGLGQTVTLGIVSALGRAGLGIEGYENFIQTDASINPGNSGGALVDMEGRLIGINSAIIGPSGGNVGIGFAIPVSMAHDVMEHLIKDGVIRRGLLGVVVQDLNAELAKGVGVSVKAGALISQVDEGTPAQQAGLAPGDVIVAIDDKPITRAAELRNLVGMHAPGDSIKLTVKRASKERTKIVTLAELTILPTPQKETEPQQGVGVLVGVVLGVAEPRSTTDQSSGGAIVLDIDENSPAANAGLEVGDVIISVNRTPVQIPEDVLQAASKLRGSEVLLLGVWKDGRTRFVALSS